MKKLIFLLVISVGLFSCGEDGSLDKESENYNGAEIAYFTDGTSSTYFVTPSEDPTTIQVGSTTVSPVARTYNVVIDSESTATQGVDFSLASSTVTIPANSYFGEITVQGIFAGVTPEGADLILRLEGNGPTEATYAMNIVQRCVSDLAGMYSVTTTYGFHDFLPNFDVNTQDVEIVEIEPGLYEIGDFSGGLYDGGPYTAAYGTGPSSFTVQFSENCGMISWENQSDPWGTCIPQDPGVNAVDFTSGVVTISWFCNGYGENGVSVYTPL